MILHLSTFLDSAKRALVHVLVMNHFLFLTILSFDVMLQNGVILVWHYIFTKAIKTFTKRRNDFESEKVECMWVEIKHLASPAVLVGYVYRNPAATHPWSDDFMQMMDKVCESNPNIVLLGDFNIDLLKPQPTWSSATSLFGLRQQICCATRITQTYATLLDHIYIQIMNKCYEKYEFLISASVTTVQSSARGNANSPKI